MSDTPLFDVARAYTHAGLSVIPIRPDGSKAPAIPVWKPYQSRLPTEAELHQWFDMPWSGLAVVCGAASGNLAVMDFETEEAYDRWHLAVGIPGQHYVKDCPLVRCPRGGRHLYLKTQTPVGCVKLARSKDKTTLIEMKGEGGYVLAPGCPAACHPSGKSYEWLRKGWVLP